jgi:hypothetical protein
VTRATTINSFADFERVFGGLWNPSAMSFAVRDFYQNGGSQAVIVRLFHPYFRSGTAREEARAAAQAVAAAADTAAGEASATAASVASAARAEADKEENQAEPRKSAAGASAAAAEAAAAAQGATPATVKDAAAAAVDAATPVTRARLAHGTLTLEAAYEGAWGNGLRARVDHDVKDAADTSTFNLTVRDGTTGEIEVFRNLSVTPTHPRNVERVLLNDSRLVRLAGSLPAARPDAHDAGAGKDVWGDNTPVTSANVADADRASNGGGLDVNDFTGPGAQARKEGLFALEQADLFNLLCIPPHDEPSGDVDPALIDSAVAYCERRRAMLIVDPPSRWGDKDEAKTGVATEVGRVSRNAALFFPRLRQPNPLHDGQLEDFVPSGAVAGVFARTDTARGVWKAPAGLEATLSGVPQLTVPLTDAEIGELNPLGVNCLRTLPAAGRVVWGARTREGDDRLASEWKYVPVRRLALFIEESLFRGTHWVVFEPNDEPLWAQIRLNVGAFMQNLFRQGAFQGSTPRDAYFVKCDKETTTQNDINLGIVNIVVGFAPLKPAEFVILKIQQMAGQIQA